MKKYYIFIIVLLIMLLTSCAMKDKDIAEDNIDAISFDYFITYEIEENNYDIYLPTNIESSIYYTNKTGNIKSSSKEWIINFIYEAVYHADENDESKEVWDGLYSNLVNSRDILDEKCNFAVTLFDPYSSVELEYVLHNNTNEEASYVIFTSYLPVRLVNKATQKTSTVGIPVKVDVLLKVKDMIENPFNDEMMSWEDFLAI